MPYRRKYWSINQTKPHVEKKKHDKHSFEVFTKLANFSDSVTKPQVADNTLDVVAVINALGDR